MYPASDFFVQVIARENELWVVCQDAAERLEPVTDTHMPQLFKVLSQEHWVVSKLDGLSIHKKALDFDDKDRSVIVVGLIHD